ncbi:MAG TPA: cell division protein FtsL [Terracidiphilus sp.]|jgi:cell division protein FtsL|nr:cell division protein FtsL [Terracidiphilus sp.]
MAACTTVFEPGQVQVQAPAQDWLARVAQRNAELLAQQPLRRRGVRTPEISFTRHFDNTRLVKASDPVRVRQMRIFSAAVAVLFSLAMVYGLQHFSAIEGSYRVESEKQQLDQLREQNRQLRLTEAQLSQPSRIDGLAHRMGMAAPQPAQVVQSTARPETSAPVYAQFTPPPPPAQ